MRLRTSGAIALGLALAACGGSDPTAPSAGAPTFSGEPLMSLASTSGALSVALRSSPNPPSRGECAFEMTLTTPAGAPATGLEVSVVPWMPTMGHGSSVAPSVSETSPGVFTVSDVVFTMPGTWELRTQISGSTRDTLTPSLQIP